MAEQTLRLRDDGEAQALFGKHDQYLRRIERGLGVSIVARGQEVKITGQEASLENAAKLFDDLLVVVRSGAPLRKDDVDYALRAMKDSRLIQLRQVYQDRIEVPSKRRFVIPRTAGQKAYVDAMRTHDIVFGIGPAGTGKTYLVMALAVSAFLNHQFNRIILTRPAVEAGEKLGFLPGDLSQKVDPYLRPLFDALYEMMDYDKVSRLIENGAIEIAPLAFMRGRTLNDAFVILDEAQNTTSMQMKMFLTRLGFNSKAVITGDVTQIDLEKNTVSGLIHSENILKNIPKLDFVYFSNRDVVRHPIIKKIIEAYEKED